MNEASKQFYHQFHAIEARIFVLAYDSQINASGGKDILAAIKELQDLLNSSEPATKRLVLC